MIKKLILLPFCLVTLVSCDSNAIEPYVFGYGQEVGNSLTNLSLQEKSSYDDPLFAEGEYRHMGMFSESQRPFAVTNSQSYVVDNGETLVVPYKLTGREMRGYYSFYNSDDTALGLLDSTFNVVLEATNSYIYPLDNGNWLTQDHLYNDQFESIIARQFIYPSEITPSAPYLFFKIGSTGMGMTTYEGEEILSLATSTIKTTFSNNLITITEGNRSRLYSLSSQETIVEITDKYFGRIDDRGGYYYDNQTYYYFEHNEEVYHTSTVNYGYADGWFLQKTEFDWYGAYTCIEPGKIALVAFYPYMSVPTYGYVAFANHDARFFGVISRDGGIEVFRKWYRGYDRVISTSFMKASDGEVYVTFTFDDGEGSGYDVVYHTSGKKIAEGDMYSIYNQGDYFFATKGRSDRVFNCRGKRIINIKSETNHYRLSRYNAQGYLVLTGPNVLVYDTSGRALIKPEDQAMVVTIGSSIYQTLNIE